MIGSFIPCRSSISPTSVVTGPKPKGSYASKKSSQLFVDCTAYKGTFDNYLIYAGVPGWPGSWSLSLPLVIPFTVPPSGLPDSPPYPGVNDLFPFGAVATPRFYAACWPNPGMTPHGKVGNAGDLIWPMPGGFVTNKEEVLGVGDFYVYDQSVSEICGIKFVDQFGNPYPINPNGDNPPVDPSFRKSRGGGKVDIQQFDASQWGRNDYIWKPQSTLAITSVQSLENGGLSVPFIDPPNTKNFTRCFPLITWDDSRMGEIADYFTSQTVCFYWTYVSGWIPNPDKYGDSFIGVLNYSSMLGSIIIDPSQIYYGPVQFVLDRPTGCKFARILNACS